MQTIIKTAIATAAFAIVHSALASRRAKRIAARMVGSERSDATYRVFYVGQGLLSFAALIAYCVRMPAHTIYRFHGTGALLLRTGQLAGAIHLSVGLRQVGLKRWAGVEKLQAWRAGRDMPLAPVAQGPELANDGRLDIRGPFRWSRHPLNFAALPLFWLTPHMTTRRLAFNAVGTAYLVLGSLHEEARLRSAYGHAYERYLDSQVPFFWPGLRPQTRLQNLPEQEKSVEGVSSYAKCRSSIVGPPPLMTKAAVFCGRQHFNFPSSGVTTPLQ
jgi:protein-S-isoprenylcysteine O-methyltransferase Ste14